MAFDNRHRGADDADLEPVRHHARLASPRVKRVSAENYDAHARQPPLLPQRCLRGSSGCGVGASSWSSTDCTVGASDSHAEARQAACRSVSAGVSLHMVRGGRTRTSWGLGVCGSAGPLLDGTTRVRTDSRRARQRRGEAAQALEALGSPADLLAAAIGNGVVTAEDRAAPMWRWTLGESVHCSALEAGSPQTADRFRLSRQVFSTLSDKNFAAWCLYVRTTRCPVAVALMVGGMARRARAITAVARHP